MAAHARSLQDGRGPLPKPARKWRARRNEFLGPADAVDEGPLASKGPI